MAEYCVETRSRIRLAVAAYAYEFDDDPIMSDGQFDRLAVAIDPTVDTGNDQMDHFFRDKFSPDTGQWIHSHPDKAGLRRILKIVGPKMRTELAIGDLI